MTAAEINGLLDGPDRLHPRDPRRVRGHQQGPGDAPHAADVGRQLDPRDRPRRRDAHRRRGDRPDQPAPVARRRRVRDDERRRRLRRHRPDAPDVPQEARRARSPPTTTRRPSVDGHARRSSRSSSGSPGWPARSAFVIGLMPDELAGDGPQRQPRCRPAGMAVAIGATAILILVRQLRRRRVQRRRLGDHRRRHRDRRRARPVHGPDREDDRDAAAGVAVQRGRRRRGGPDRDRRLPRLVRRRPPSGSTINIFIVLDIIIGSITFTGSLIASGKLQGLIPGKPILVPGGRLVTARPRRDHGRRGGLPVRGRHAERRGHARRSSPRR